MKKIINQVKKKRKSRGNSFTRSLATTIGQLAQGLRSKKEKQPLPSWFDPGQGETKFMLRPRRMTPKRKFKKYPVPHVWDNPRPEGNMVEG